MAIKTEYNPHSGTISKQTYVDFGGYWIDNLGAITIDHKITEKSVKVRINGTDLEDLCSNSQF